jgi:hypothetical protein
MDATTNKRSGPAGDVLDDSKISDFALMDESAFVEVIQEAFARLHEESWSTFSPRYAKFRSTGVVLDKPTLMITVGSTEFQIIIVKTS